MKLLLGIFRYIPFSLKCKIVDFLLEKKGIKIIQAKTQEELEQVFRLRFEVYKDEDYIDPNDYPDKKLTDKYEPYSVSFLALKGKEPIGTVRIIKKSDLGFSTEHAFNILEFPQDYFQAETAELSKLCVKEQYRKGLVSLGILRKAFEYSEKNMIKYWLMFTTKKLANYFDGILGVSVNILFTGNLNDSHLAERAIAGKKYFQKFDLYPYILEISTVKKF